MKELIITWQTSCLCATLIPTTPEMQLSMPVRAENQIYQDFGPNVAPGATLWRIAVPSWSIVCSASVLPHQLGNLVFDS